MSHTLKDRPQPRKEQSDESPPKDRLKRATIRTKIHQLDPDDWEAWDELESFEKM